MAVLTNDCNNFSPLKRNWNLFDMGQAWHNSILLGIMSCLALILNSVIASDFNCELLLIQENLALEP